MVVDANLVMIVNVVLAIWLVASLTIGYIKGLLMQLVGLVSLIVSILVANLYAATLAAQISIWPKDIVLFSGTVLEGYFYGKMNIMAWYVLLFIGCNILFLFARPLLKGVGEIPVIKEVNTLAGMAVSFLKFALTLCVIVFILKMPIINGGKDLVDKTYLSKVDQISSSIFSSVEDKIVQNELVQKLISGEKEGLSVEDLAEITKWLEMDGLSADQILEFINQITK